MKNLNDHAVLSDVSVCPFVKPTSVKKIDITQVNAQFCSQKIKLSFVFAN